MCLCDFGAFFGQCISVFISCELVECCLHLQQSIVKGEIGTETLRHLALETIVTHVN